VDCPRVPANDICTNATMIDTLPFTTEGNNEQASVAGYNSWATSCVLVQETSPTTWYKVSLQGNGATCVKASLFGYSFDAILAVYSSADSCKNLGCIDQSNSDTVAWKAEEGETDYVVVASSGEWTRGPFSLEISVSV